MCSLELTEEMEEKASMRRFGIIADDLTGAMDTGVGFARIGLDTIISFGNEVASEASVVVISTDSRADDGETAYRKTRKEAHKLAGLYVYKKIDSTLRGNISSELWAVIDALHTEKTIMCPAFPANKRSVVDGKLLVENTPVNETYFAYDPISPVTEAHIPTLLHKQGGFEVGSIDLEGVKKGPSYIAQQILESEQRVIVVDAVKQVHLRYIAKALAMGSGSWLPCGSAGLASELPLAFGYRTRDVKPAGPIMSRNPVLLVIGSRNDATARQLKEAETRLNLPLISIEPSEFAHRKGRIARMNQLAREVSNLISCGRSVIITSTLSRYVPALKGSTAGILAAIAVRAARRWDIAGLILSGGDVARATCEALGVTGIRILRELQPGIVVGEMTGSMKEGMRVVTKAGGFGSDDAIVDAICYLKGNEKGGTEKKTCTRHNHG